MKTMIKSINPRIDDKSEVMNVTVIMSDDNSALRIRNAHIDVYVDKQNKTIDDIEKAAISQAIDFLEELLRAHRP